MAEVQVHQKNVPELRFLHFDQMWENKKLSELMDFSNGINASKDSYGYGRKFINVLDILENNFIIYEDIKDSVSVKHETEMAKNVEFGDLLFLRSSETREDVGKSSVYLDDKYYALFGGFVIRGKKKSVYNPYFLKLNLETSKARKQISTKAGGSTRFNVSQSILSSVTINLPSIKEQQKIGEFFSKLDQQIEWEEKKLALLEEQKKGYMQKVFSQELRFKDKNGNSYPKWEINKFSCIYETHPVRQHQIKSSEVKESGLYIVVDQGKNNILGYTDDKEKLIDNNYEDLIVYGDHTTVVKYIKGPFVVGGDGVKLLKPKLKGNTYYFVILLSVNNVNAEGYKRHFTILKEKNIFISQDEEEKEKIGSFFQKLDQRIELQSKKIEFLKIKKQGFLQKMFV